MKLSVTDRLYLINAVLPKKGNLTTMTAADEVSKMIAFSTEELEKIGLQNLPDGHVQWDASKDEGREVKLNRSQLKVIEDSLTELDKKSELVPETAKLHVMFLGDSSGKEGSV